MKKGKKTLEWELLARRQVLAYHTKPLSQTRPTPTTHEPGMQKPSIRSAKQNASTFFSVTRLPPVLHTMESLSDTQWDVVIKSEAKRS